MATDRPDRDDIAQGMTVKIVQEKPTSDDTPIFGVVKRVLPESKDDPDGVRVRLKSGITGRVVEVTPDEDERDAPQGGS